MPYTLCFLHLGIQNNIYLLCGMNKLYPLKFKSIFKEKIWGGQKIRTILGKDFAPLTNCGEMWVVSGVQGDQSIVENGFLAGNELNELVEVYMGDLVGEKNYEKYGNEFPVLIKFIDANDYLSIQVHPDDALAKKRHGGNGKTEMWYVLDAEPGSELISGFKKKVDKEEYLEHLENKTIKDILNVEKVKEGDVFYIPSGRVHALGPGILLAEIQQTSDITYRIYDWDRPGIDGVMRELHTDLAVDAIDREVYDDYKTSYDKEKNKSVELVSSPNFVTNLLDIDINLQKDYSALDSFVVLLCVDGSFMLDCDDGEMKVNKGEAAVIPAVTEKLILKPFIETKIIEIYILQ